MMMIKMMMSMIIYVRKTLCYRNEDLCVQWEFAQVHGAGGPGEIYLITSESDVRKVEDDDDDHQIVRRWE